MDIVTEIRRVPLSSTHPMKAPKGEGRKVLLICLFLLLSILAVYWPLASHQFINYDDQDYLTDNLNVQAGLTWKGIVWAFSTGYAGNWHPLTWVSHMLDCQIYGMNAGVHHVTNLLLHIGNTLLLFFVLKRMTRALWRSAI